MTLSKDQKVVWWRGPTRGRLTAVRGTVRKCDCTKVELLLDEGGQRWVPAARVQPIQRWYHSWPAPDHIRFESPVNRWGRCTIHTEVHEDLFVNRCVYEFENCKYLRYDRTHWWDNFGSLGTLAYCHFRWNEFWGEAIAVTWSEFERVWRLADEADDDVQKLDRSMPKELTEIQPWKRTPVVIGT